MSAHALFSPSATDRWITCPGSVTLTEQLQIKSSGHSIYSAEGTTTHAIAEMALRLKYIEREDPTAMLEEALEHRWLHYAEGLGEFAKNAVTDDMIWQVKVYMDAVAAIVEPQDTVWIEHRVFMNPALYGTVDLLVIKPSGDVYLIDLKTGAGKEVSAENNQQLLTYAACFAAESDNILVKRWHLVIVQPPFEPAISSHQVTPKAVKAHGAELLEVLYKVEHGIAGRVTGDHCRWCPARAACPTLQEMARDAATRSYEGISPEGWDVLLKLAVRLEPWCKAVKERAQAAAEGGAEIPNWKLVQKFGRTTWDDPVLAETTLLAAGASRETILNPATLRTPLQVKKVNKDIFDENIVNELTVTPDRGVTLTTAEDKRKAIAPIGSRIKALGAQLKLSGV